MAARGLLLSVPGVSGQRQPKVPKEGAYVATDITVATHYGYIGGDVKTYHTYTLVFNVEWPQSTSSCSLSHGMGTTLWRRLACVSEQGGPARGRRA